MLKRRLKKAMKVEQLDEHARLRLDYARRHSGRLMVLTVPLKFNENIERRRGKRKRP